MRENLGLEFERVFGIAGKLKNRSFWAFGGLCFLFLNFAGLGNESRNARKKKQRKNSKKRNKKKHDKEYYLNEIFAFLFILFFFVLAFYSAPSITGFSILENKTNPIEENLTENNLQLEIPIITQDLFNNQNKKVEKVTDESKKVKNKAVLIHLEKEGIDPDYVELIEDYDAKDENGKAKHVYSRVYKDRKSGKHIAEFSGLPMARAIDGEKIITNWYEENGLFYNEPNLFDAVVDRTKIKVSVVDNSLTEYEIGDYVEWNPQLFVGSKEIYPISGSAIIVDFDPMDEIYQNNTLEWDYGVCKRQLILIEGLIRERWVFAESPNGEIRIKHNQNGEIALELGSGIAANTLPLPLIVENGDEEVLDDFTDITFPIQIGSSLTFYSGIGTVAGYVRHRDDAGLTWGEVQQGAGTEGNILYFGSVQFLVTADDTWRLMDRGIMMFYTESIPDTATISAATLSLFGETIYSPKKDELEITPNVNIYSAAPASTFGLEAGDYDSLGTAAFCDTAMTYAGWTDAAYNAFTLNASGIAAILKTGVSKFGFRNPEYDVANSEPWKYVGDDQTVIAFSPSTGSNPPKLVVTYTVADGTTCTVDGDCTDAGSHCEYGPNTATQYCADSAKECGRSGVAGYDTGEEVNNDECQAAGTWLCNAGYYNPSGACTTTTAGYYSLEDSDSQTACPAGTYGTGGSTSSSCTGQCAAGYYGSNTARTTSSCDGLCAAGRYGSAGQTTNQCTGACLAGYYGTAGTVRTTSACDGQCTAGYYCQAGSISATQNACPTYTYSPTGSDAINDCTSCLYSGSGNWRINATENCTVSTVTNGAGANLDITGADGAGTITLNTNISNFNTVHIDNSVVTCQAGCFK